MMNLQSFSQTDTNNICLPKRITHLIAIDLVKGDSAIAELNLTQIKVNQQLNLLNEKDSTISILSDKNQNLLSQIDGSNSKEKIYKAEILNLEKTIKKKNTLNKILMGLSLILGTAFIIK